MNEPNPPSARPGLDLEGVLALLRREGRLVLGFFAIVVGVAGVGTALTPRKYEAVAVVQLLPRAGQEVEVKEVVRNDDGGYMESRDRARTQIQIMLSRGLREKVLAAYLAEGHTDLPSGEEGVDALGRMLSAGPREDTQLVELRVEHRDPEQAAILANLMADVYVRENLTSRTDAARETQGWLDVQRELAQTALTEASAKLLDFKRVNDLVDAEEDADGVTSRLASLQSALSEAGTRRAMLESSVRQHQRLAAEKQFEVLAGMYTDPGLDAMVKDRARILTESSEILARYGEQHPDHQRAMERIRRAEALIAAEVERKVEAEASEAAGLRAQERQLSAELETVKGELLQKQHLQTDYDALKAEEERARWLTSALAQRRAEVDLQAHSRLNDVRVVDRAVPPTRPSTPNVPVNLAVALALGLGGGLGLALVRHRVDDSLREPAEVQGALGARLLGALPHLDKQSLPERALYTFEHPRSQPAEAVRGLRGLLQATLPGRRCVLVTSSDADEGKTHAAVQLAVAFAQMGQKVLLVDADLRCPQVHVVFGLPEAPGLSDAVEHPEDAARHVVASPVPNLDILPRGQPVDYPNELVSGPGLAALLAGLRERYEVIVVDTPPAGVVTDALFLGPLVDGVVMVVRVGGVGRALARDTLRRVAEMGGKLLGVVLNDVVLPRSGSKYYDDRRRTAPAPPKA